MAAISLLINATAAGKFTGKHNIRPFSPLRSPINAPGLVSGASAPFSLLTFKPSSQIPTHSLASDLPSPTSGDGDGKGGASGGGNHSGGGGGGDDNPGDESSTRSGPFDLFIEGWRSRVRADPQFPFKVLMEEIVGVSACVLGDMASRPNFGLNELDFVFSTLVVGSILNFVLMYLLAPTSATAALAAKLPGLFAASPASHMFEPGAYSIVDRLGTFVYKGVVFGAVGFFAGLAGTAISNGLIAFRKKCDPEFETPNKPPPTLLNAGTWALHMGLSSNFRYQTLNGVEFLMEKALPAAGFKMSVLVLRCLNNILGGMSFVVLARMTGSQKVEEKGGEKERLIRNGDDVVVVVEEVADSELQRSEAKWFVHPVSKLNLSSSKSFNSMSL